MASRKLFSLFGSIAIEGLKKSSKEMKEFNKKAAGIKKRMNAIRKETMKLGKSITKFVTLPLLAAGGAALKFGADFEAAMTKSLSIMGDVSDEMKKEMSDVARAVAIDLNLPAKTAAESYFFLASAGLNAAQSMKALPKVLAFAKAGTLDAALATDLLTDAQTALGLESDITSEHIKNMVGISDLLVKANTIANGSVQQFSEAITNRAGAAMKLLKKDATEGIAVLAAFASQNIKGAEAGTKLDIVWRDMQKAAINNKQAFIDAGIAVFDASGKMRHTADIIEDMENRLGDMSDEQRRSELMMLGFTDKSVSATAALLGTSDAIREYEESLKLASGTTEDVANKQLQTFWQQLGIVQKKLVDVGLELFDKMSPTLMDVLIPALNAVVDSLAGLVEWFSNLNPVIKDAVVVFVASLAVLGPLAVAIAGLMPLITGIQVLYAAWIAKQITLNAVMSANVISIIVLAIAALIAAGYALIKNWDEVKEAMANVWGGVVDFFKILGNDIKRVWTTMILGIVKGLQKVAKFIGIGEEKLKSMRAELEKNLDVIKKEIKVRKDLNKVITDGFWNALSGSIALNKAEAARFNAIKKAKEEAKKEEARKRKASLDEIARRKKVAKARVEFQKQWSDKLFEATKTEREILAKAEKEALAEAKRLGANKSDVISFYAAKNAEIDKKEADAKKEIDEKALEDKEDMEISWNQKYRALTQTRVEILEDERDEALRLAHEKGAKTLDIEKFYAQKIGEAKVEAAKEASAKIEEDLKKRLFGEFRAQLQHTKGLKEQKKIAVQNAKETGGDVAKVNSDFNAKIQESRLESVQAGIKDSVNAISAGVNAINSLWQASLNKRVAEIDAETNARIEGVNASVLSEEEKDAAISEINAEADAKKLELQRENAKREKANSLFSIALSTAMGVASALTIPPPAGIVLAAIVGALGLVQLGVAAATPIPFAEGGMVKASPGGIIAQIGEGKEDETVLPMKTGVEQIAKNLMSRLSSFGAESGLFGGGGKAKVSEVHNHWHIGALIADKLGIKMLEKEMRPFRVADAQRRGV